MALVLSNTYSSHPFGLNPHDPSHHPYRQPDYFNPPPLPMNIISPTDYILRPESRFRTSQRERESQATTSRYPNGMPAVSVMLPMTVPVATRKAPPRPITTTTTTTSTTSTIPSSGITLVPCSPSQSPRRTLHRVSSSPSLSPTSPTSPPPSAANLTTQPRRIRRSSSASGSGLAPPVPPLPSNLFPTSPPPLPKSLHTHHRGQSLKPSPSLPSFPSPPHHTSKRPRSPSDSLYKQVLISNFRNNKLAMRKIFQANRELESLIAMYEGPDDREEQEFDETETLLEGEDGLRSYRKERGRESLDTRKSVELEGSVRRIVVSRPEKERRKEGRVGWGGSKSAPAGVVSFLSL